MKYLGMISTKSKIETIGNLIKDNYYKIGII